MTDTISAVARPLDALADDNKKLYERICEHIRRIQRDAGHCGELLSFAQAEAIGRTPKPPLPSQPHELLRTVQAANRQPYYVDELVTIIHGDSRDLVPTVDASALIVADPPYNIGYRYDRHDDAMPLEAYFDLLGETLRPPCIVIHRPEMVVPIARRLRLDPTRVIAWVYPSNTPRQSRAIAWFGCTPDLKRYGQPYKNPNDRRIRARIEKGRTARLYDWWLVNQVKNVSREKTPHPCQIPEEVMRRILAVTPAALVVDPFAGSGTTLVAAKQLGVRAIGIEMSDAYCAIAADRVRNVVANVISTTLGVAATERGTTIIGRTR